MATDGPSRKRVVERIAAREAREMMSELMNRARFGGERFLITRNGEDVAAIIGAPEFFEKFRDVA